MSAHTPGPWPEPEYDTYGNGGFSEWWEIPGIARVYEEADARLIAAAPEMLHALEMVRDANRDDPHIPSIALATIEAAIAKATGGDQ